MAPNEYQELASQTAVYPRAIEIPYLIIGLCGEVSEFEDAWTDDAEADELGDIVWYISQLMRALGFDMEDSLSEYGIYDADIDGGWSNTAVGAALHYHAGSIANTLKKFLRDQRPPTSGELNETESTLVWMYLLIGQYLAEKGDSIERIMSLNILKLGDRHGQ